MLAELVVKTVPIPDLRVSSSKSIDHPALLNWMSLPLPTTTAL